MTITPQQKITQLESLNRELMRLIREFKHVTDHPELDQSIQEKGAQLYELAHIYEEVRDSNLTLDQWMGQYLLGAKAEVTRLLTEAVSLARIVSIPMTERQEVGDGMDQVYLPHQTGVLEDIASQSTPMSRLTEISERANAQCAALMDELEQTV